MREIIFRGVVKKPHDGAKGIVWRYGGYYTDLDKSYILTSSDFIPVLPHTVGQYTGLTDDNDVKIFEGDICEITLFDPFGHDKQYIVKVVFEYGAFVFDNKGETIPFYMIDDFESDVEVIGNIYDNPELLRGGGNNEV